MALYKSVYYYYHYLLSNPSALVDVSKGSISELDRDAENAGMENVGL